MHSPVGDALRAPRLLVALLGLLLVAAPTVLVTSSATAGEPFVLSGSVSGPADEAPAGVIVSVLPAGGGAVVAADTSRLVDGDAVYAVRDVPAGSYWVRFDKTGYATAYLENDEDDDPATVTVDATGKVTAAGVELDDGLLPDVSLLLSAPTLKQAPTLSGRATVGQTLTVSTGTWEGITVDTDYVTVEWFIGGQDADDYSDGAWWQRFDVPLEAVGARIGFRLTVEDPDGARADAVYDGASTVVPKAVSSLKATVSKGKATVIASVAGVPRPTGKVTVKAGKKVVGAARLKAKSKGKVVVRLHKLKPGKRKLVVSYAGPSTIAPAHKVVKVKIPR